MVQVKDNAGRLQVPYGVEGYILAHLGYPWLQGSGVAIISKGREVG